MAQLRDKQTSQFIFDGTPLEVATLASKIGFDEVIFDDVTLDFDPQAVIALHAATLDAIPSDADEAYVAQVNAADKLPRGAIKDAQAAIQAARDAVEQG